jgi:hypothetical protein
VYQALNVVGVGLPNQSQPFQNSDGESIMMGEETFKMLISLLEAQEYIESVLEYRGEKVDYDLDEMRLKVFTNQPLGSLARWPFYAFPELACDLSEPSISVSSVSYPTDFSRVAICNFTNRYRNNWINYFFLKQYEERLCFVGLQKEHEDFNKKWGLKINYLQLDNFLELAWAMKNSIGFLGNQSMAFQIAENLKISRILEVYQMMPNVIPCGGKFAVDFYHQQALELYVSKLFNA